MLGGTKGAPWNPWNFLVLFYVHGPYFRNSLYIRHLQHNPGSQLRQSGLIGPKRYALPRIRVLDKARSTKQSVV